MGRLMKPLTYQCPVMYRPTFPVRLARPSGKRPLAERRSRWELQAWPAAITKSSRAELDGLIGRVPVDRFGEGDPVRIRLEGQAPDPGCG